MGERQYFFSYSRHDAPFVLKLAQELRDSGVHLWLDQLDIAGGQRWDRAVQDALTTCKGVLAVLSPESITSNSVMDEISYALDANKLVIPILLRACDVPFRLRRVQHIDFADSYDYGFSRLLIALSVDQQPRMPVTELAGDKDARSNAAPATATSESEGVDDAQHSHVDRKNEDAKTAQQGASNKAAGRPSSGQRSKDSNSIIDYVPWVSTLVLVLLWMGGIAMHVGDGLIHILLVIAVIMIVIRAVRVAGERRRKAV